MCLQVYITSNWNNKITNDKLRSLSFLCVFSGKALSMLLDSMIRVHQLNLLIKISKFKWRKQTSKRPTVSYTFAPFNPNKK